MPANPAEFLSLCPTPLFVCRTHTSSGKRRSRDALAWSRAIMEAIVQPKQARTPGDTRLPHAQAVHVSFFSRWCTSEKMCHLRACKRRKIRISLRGPSELRDIFHERPRQHKPIPTLHGQGACGKQAAVVYTSLDTQTLLYLSLNTPPR